MRNPRLSAIIIQLFVRVVESTRIYLNFDMYIRGCLNESFFLVIVIIIWSLKHLVENNVFPTIIESIWEIYLYRIYVVIKERCFCIFFMLDDLKY